MEEWSEEERYPIVFGYRVEINYNPTDLKYGYIYISGEDGDGKLVTSSQIKCFSVDVVTRSFYASFFMYLCRYIMSSRIDVCQVLH